MKRNARILVGWLAATVLLVSQAADAVEFSLWPNAQILGAYNNNINVSATNTKGDFLSAISPGATVESDTAARDFFLTYQTMVLTYLNYSDEDRFGRDNYLGLRDFERIGPDTSLAVSDSFLMGNAVSSGLMANGSTPVGPQLMQALLNQSTSSNNEFNAQLTTRFSNTFKLSATVFQNTFIGPSSSVSEYSFNQGGTLAADRYIGEKLTAGFSYQFSDFRFSNGDVPTTDANWPQLRLSWGAETPFNLLAQVGPVISSSTAGLVGTTPERARTSVDVGFLLTAHYADRRLSITSSGGQAPSLSSGLGGFSTAQTYSALVQYKLTRLTTAYMNGGYYAASGTGLSDHVFSYSAGITYRMNRMLALNASYFGYQTRIGGSGPTTTSPNSTGSTNTNMFLLGLIVTPEPFRWNF